MAKSKIEWTDDTWNPIVGCSIVSPGCTNCYAMKMANRLSHNPATPQYHGTIQPSRKGPVWTGKVAFAEKAFLEPLKRRKPTTYFVNSMGDLFHEDVPDAWVDRVFAVMALCPQHTFQVLTKRADRMREYMNSAFDRIVMHMIRLVNEEGVPTVRETCKSHGIPWAKPKSANDWWPLRNVWLGVSVEDQARADERIPALLNTPAAIRFVSAEPLLGPLDLSDRCNGWYFANWLSGTKWHDNPGISKVERGGPSLDWVIVGGESGPNARPMHPKWARDLRDQCEAAGTAFFFKQWGEWCPGENVPHQVKGICQNASWFSDGWDIGQTDMDDPEDGWMDEIDLYRVGKKAAGRLLDGREWNGVPE
ncbi:MAG: phage Gp37/Gp68 family protein [Rhodobacteraceae bacterium]|nr:phage Gp37/Gp68 family protein [Paracoccaceae bacterium]